MFLLIGIFVHIHNIDIFRIPYQSLFAIAQTYFHVRKQKNKKHFEMFELPVLLIW